MYHVSQIRGGCMALRESSHFRFMPVANSMKCRRLTAPASSTNNSLSAIRSNQSTIATYGRVESSRGERPIKFSTSCAMTATTIPSCRVFLSMPRLMQQRTRGHPLPDSLKQRQPITLQGWQRWYSYSCLDVRLHEKIGTRMKNRKRQSKGKTSLLRPENDRPTDVQHLQRSQSRLPSDQSLSREGLRRGLC